jgi:hypothetical protein
MSKLSTPGSIRAPSIGAPRRRQTTRNEGWRAARVAAWLGGLAGGSGRNADIDGEGRGFDDGDAPSHPMSLHVRSWLADVHATRKRTGALMFATAPDRIRDGFSVVQWKSRLRVTSPCNIVE